MKKKIVLVTKLDGTATEARTDKLQILLSPQYKIYNINTQNLIKKNLKHLLDLPISILISSSVSYLLYKLKLTNRPIVKRLKIRGYLVDQEIRKINPDCLICGTGEDMACFLHNQTKLKILDIPTPYADELKYSNKYPARTIKAVEKIEKECLQSADFFCANWTTYTKWLSKKYNLYNTLPATSGCEKTNQTTCFETKPKIVFVGNLEGYWTNLQLLNNICKSSNFPLDIFAPKNNLGRGVNYKGYLNNYEKLTKYQFGLLTISKDPLRKVGFSAKHLLYISYGLPVLCPEWRQDKILDPATIYFNENNFNAVLKKYSRKKPWLKKHRAALKLAENLQWEKTLSPILKVIDQKI